MKESVSVTAIFQIVILFILLFTAIMCLTINNSNAFAVKDEIVNIIEVNGGEIFKDGSGTEIIDDIVDIMSQQQYRSTGDCNKYGDGYNGYDRNGAQVSNDDAAFCIKKIDVLGGKDNYLKERLDVKKVAKETCITGYYYQVVVFYQLDLPVISSTFNMNTKGETRVIYDITPRNERGEC